MNKFKCKDEVIYRYADDCVWRYGIYSHYNKIVKAHFLVGDSIPEYWQIIYYKDNEHLVGTTDNPQEEVILEQEEIIMCFDTVRELYNLNCVLNRFKGVSESSIIAEGNWDFCIPFKDFNPNDMEETRKHILYVKNGKLVIYGK